MNAAATRIYKNKTLLNLWLSYYSRYFDDLYVVACNSPHNHFEDLVEKYGFLLIPIDVEIYSQPAHETVFKLQKNILKTHEWFLYSDADEIIVPDPDKYRDLKDFMDKCKDKQTFCRGYEIIKTKDERPIDYQKPYMKQRSMWVKDTTASYHKPALSRKVTEWDMGFHHLRGHKKEDIESTKDVGLRLIHLKYADPDREFDFKHEHTGTRQKGPVGNPVRIPDKFKEVF